MGKHAVGGEGDRHRESPPLFRPPRPPAPRVSRFLRAEAGARVQAGIHPAPCPFSRTGRSGDWYCHDFSEGPRARGAGLIFSKYLGRKPRRSAGARGWAVAVQPAGVRPHEGESTFPASTGASSRARENRSPGSASPPTARARERKPRACRIVAKLLPCASPP